jgi:hypothetical protein
MIITLTIALLVMSVLSIVADAVLDWVKDGDAK